jgi:hypothetical protein
MKSLINILIILCCILNSNAQEFEYNRISVFAKIDWVTDSTAMVGIELQNTSAESIYIYPIEESNIFRTMPKFIGIGLYSHIFPYLPRHTDSFSGDILLMPIKPNELVRINEICKVERGSRMKLGVDYFSSSHYINDEIIKVNINEYDNHCHFVELLIKTD